MEFVNQSIISLCLYFSPPSVSLERIILVELFAPRNIYIHTQSQIKMSTLKNGTKLKCDIQIALRFSPFISLTGVLLAYGRERWRFLLQCT